MVVDSAPALSTSLALMTVEGAIGVGAFSATGTVAIAPLLLNLKSVVVESPTLRRTGVYGVQTLSAVVTLPAVIVTIISLLCAIEALSSTVLVTETTSTGGSAVVVVIKVICRGCSRYKVVIKCIAKRFYWSACAWRLLALLVSIFTCWFWADTWLFFFSFFFTFFLNLYKCSGFFLTTLFTFASLFFTGNRFTLLITFFTLDRDTCWFRWF